MTVKVPEKNVAARWTHATAITFLLYLMMVVNPSQSPLNSAPEWRSSAAQTSSAQLAVNLPTLPLLSW